MATSPRPGNGGIPFPHPLLLVLLLTFLTLLGGCSASTTTGSSQTPARPRELEGRITQFPLPASDNSPSSITTGPDVALWFTEDHKIGRITPVGHISEFPLPTPADHSGNITAGSDSNLWFTETTLVNLQNGQVKLVGKIGRITPAWSHQ